MKKISEINSMYPNIDSTNVVSDKDMNQVPGGGDCKSCGENCKGGCSSSLKTGTSQSQLQSTEISPVSNAGLSLNTESAAGYLSNSL